MPLSKHSAKEQIVETRTSAGAFFASKTTASLVILGYAAVGDGGFSIYGGRSSVAPSPVKAWHLQTADGDWWTLKAGRRVSIKQLGAVGDRVADDTNAVKAARDYLVPTGGEIYAPAGSYRITSQIDFDFTLADTFDDRFGINLVGDGSANTMFSTPAALTLTFKITSGSVAHGSPCDIHWRGFCIVADTAATSGAIDLVFAANMTFTDIVTYNFARHWRLIDCLSSTFIRCKMIYGHVGMQGYFQSVSPLGSSPNAISCFGCQAYFLNQHAVLLFQPYAFLWSGGSMEGCGGSNSPTATVGNADACAAWINGCAGGVAANFVGVHFESDVGAAVVRATADTTYEMTVNVLGCTFGNNATTAQDLIRVDAATKHVTMNLTGSSFWDTPAYTPGGGRKDFKAYGGSDAWTLVDDGVKWSSSGARPAEMSSTTHASAEITGATGALVTGRNVASTSRVSAGYFRINYRKNTLGGSAVATVLTNSVTAVHAYVWDLGAGFIEIKVTNASTGVAVDPGSLYVTVWN
jgi:hypothetical protein